MKKFTKDELPAAEEFAEYRKTATTKLARIDGQFEVETREGTLTCEDGYVALDADGWPYPIEASVLARTYELVGEEGDE